jgi:hypothetical protein
MVDSTYDDGYFVGPVTRIGSDLAVADAAESKECQFPAFQSR